MIKREKNKNEPEHSNSVVDSSSISTFERSVIYENIPIVACSKACCKFSPPFIQKHSSISI